MCFVCLCSVMLARGERNKKTKGSKDVKAAVIQLSGCVSYLVADFLWANLLIITVTQMQKISEDHTQKHSHFLPPTASPDLISILLAFTLSYGDIQSQTPLCVTASCFQL